MKRLATAIILACVLAACEGPVGPQGPAGPPGPQGQQGAPGRSVTMLSKSGRIPSDGLAIVSFPGVDLDRAVVNCWAGTVNNGTLVWFKISFASEDLFCSSIQDGNTLVVGVGAPGGWRYMVVVATS